MKRFWTAEEEKRFLDLYPHVSTSELARLMGRSERSLYAHADVVGLRKSPEYLSSPAAYRFRRGGGCGKEYRFPKGNVPFNKGLRRPGWGPGRMKETQFKAGNKPFHIRQLGEERITKEGYTERKISETGTKRDWKMVQVLAWEQANGPVPSGHVVIFRDGDKSNPELSNLELVPRPELMRRNSYHTKYPKEVGLAIQLVGALNRQIRKRTK